MVWGLKEVLLRASAGGYEDLRGLRSPRVASLWNGLVLRASTVLWALV